MIGRATRFFRSRLRTIQGRECGRRGGAGHKAYEGLSWAAWWLDDDDAVFEAHERAYRLYRERGDAAGAARMATWLAADQLDFRGDQPERMAALDREFLEFVQRRDLGPAGGPAEIAVEYVVVVARRS